MARVEAVAPRPEEGLAQRPAAGRLDLAGLKAVVEEAVCRAWQEEMAGRKEGEANMDMGPVHAWKPAEMAPPQASGLTDGTPVASHVSANRGLCQEVLARVLATVEERALAAYEEVQAQSLGLLKEMDHIQRRAAAAQGALALAAAKAQEQDETEQGLLQEARAAAQAALAPYVAAGVVTPKEAEEHLEGAFRQIREQFQAQRQEARARLEAVQAEFDQLRAGEAELESRREALQTRLAQLRVLPCIVALERTRQEKEERRNEAVWEAIHFLETAPWHELSWQKQITARLEAVVALAGEDPTVFEALVDRLGRELERVDPAARPGIGWSVVRAIEALEMERLFPNLEAVRAGLVRAARQYHREKQSAPPMADKIVSLASRWGARVAAR